MDYRYFPEPDLLPLELSEDFIENARKQIPELPIEKRIRYLNDYKLSEDDARILTTDRDLSEYFDELVKLTKDAKKSCSYITTILLAMMNESENIKKVTDLKFEI
jgi:aspartyl/glutamyl-tRNA(asn/gln) amidotransferase subunit B